ncbi:S-adenosylhomocysteine deaminase [Halorhodospira halochloris]|uniref:5-methylthioadenosine/S-adenosylhomocysteine deaminase n=1 Tax=Halorhodospira halochloris TaxID=1052 RepID=A0A0X8X8Y5_HALHR|nr:TRZ/ATZ family hydrolase [Halorhodospira halochloris]MBK1651494.1 N-ethylammeline chlorohydrolase [Halorhodospira halochloris]BAU57242.1 S-adenosylhomocysteine deaminase [Halorhodospira halochloris]
MERVDSLIHARWVIPVEPEGAVLENFGVAIEAGRIVDLAPSAELNSRYTSGQVRNLDQHALIPGLINSHTHAAMTLLRGLADDLPLMTWLTEHIWPAEQRWVGEEFVRAGSTLAIGEMLRGGVTCFNDMYFFPEQTAQAAKDAGMRAVIGMIVINVPSAYASGPQEYLHKGLEFHDKYKDDPLIRPIFSPHAPYTVDEQWLTQVRTYSDELQLPIHMHVHETADEISGSLDQHGKRPLQRLDEMGLVSPHLLAIHATQLEEAEIERLAEAGAHVVHCPESNLKLASGFCPSAALDEAGVNVALGTDSAASNNDLDMIGEMRTAALLGKAVAANAAAIPASRVLRMATLNGAQALGIDDLVGSIEPGKQADLAAINLNEIELSPIYNPLSHLVYATNRQHVSDVWVAGKNLVREGRLSTVDKTQAIKQAEYWRSQIAAENSKSV